jgi:hypothetical protein
MEPRIHDDQARTNEVGQVGQLQTRKKAYEKGNLANSANLISVFLKSR